jgi:hypothetical protein
MPTSSAYRGEALDIRPCLWVGVVVGVVVVGVVVVGVVVVGVVVVGVEGVG